jgi:Ribulose-5-phosphate 4-epimerase and related epimerases and aldolases
MIPALAITNVFWLTFAPITSIAEKYYGVSALSIAFLSMSYMIIYIIMAFPASWLVDTKGFRASIATGAIITAVFGMLRGIYASNFTMVTITQLGVAIGQPFLVNAITKAAARWFPIDERATASGIATMAGYIGMVVALVLTPSLTIKYGLPGTLLFFGYAAIICAVIFILFARERPKTAPGPGEELVNKLNAKDVIRLFHHKDFSYLLICLFVIMGIFNAIMTWIEDIVKPHGISSDQAGLIGGIMVIIGLVGAVILPALSDKTRKRRSFLIWPILFAIPGFIGLTFFANYWLLLISSAVMGFFVLGIGPIAFQYGAETAYPVPEGTSYGMLMTAGQISGIIFIYGMDALRQPASGNMTLPLIILIALMLAVLFLSTKLKESNLIANIAVDNDNVAELDTVPAAETLSRAAEQLNNLERRGFISCKMDQNNIALCPEVRGAGPFNPKDIIIVNLNVPISIAGDPLLQEATLHREIYKQRPEINGIVHTFFPDAGIIAALYKQVPPVLDDMAQIIGPSLKVCPNAPVDRRSVQSVIKSLTARNAVLLVDNGAICVGRDMDEALVACEILEKSCKVFIESGFLGGGVPVNSIEARLMHLYYLKKYSQQKKRKPQSNHDDQGNQTAPGKIVSAEMATAQKIVCDSGRRLLKSGLVSGTWGNISCRVDDTYMAITPSGRDYDLLNPEDIVIVNIHDCSYEGNMKPSSEKGLHAAIYKQKPEICAVIHTHAPNASVVAAARREVPLESEAELRLIGQSIKIAAYALPGTKKLVKATMQALEDRNAVLMANHGAICTGKDMDEAFAACEALENSCIACIDSARSSDVSA